MLDNINLGFWDVLLLIVVTFQAVLIAYFAQPKWKAFIITLPFPFSISLLAIGQDVDATNMLGLLLLLLFTYGVKVFHINFSVPIIVAIVLAAVGYCVLGTTSASMIPEGEFFFWAATAGILLLAIAILARQSYSNEPNYRSPLPIWKKLPIILVVVILLILLKNNLKGFMTVFPMVGVVGAYEARRSLGAMCRQIPIIILTIGPMMIFIKLTQGHLGIETSLLLSWIIFLAFLIPLTIYMNKKLPASTATASA